MPYSAFTSVSQLKKAFGLTLKEGDRFIPPDLPPIIPDPILTGFLDRTLTLATIEPIDRLLAMLVWMVEKG